MNTKEYIALLNRPYSLSDKQTDELEKVLANFPFLQSARAIHLKGLYNRDSFRYNTELKKTASFTTDRSVLFDFITSEQFQSIDKKLFEDSEKAVADITINGLEDITAPIPANKLEESIKQTIIESGGTETVQEPEEIVAENTIPVEDTAVMQQDETEEKLGIGKPLTFDKTETHSFSEWLQLSKLSPIVREEIEEEAQPDEPNNSGGLSDKLDLIDKFIETNPKIVPVKNAPAPPPALSQGGDSSSLMTETLARVYLEQKKYSKAIQAYEILILKYPEKSVFFADRIEEIRNLQQNNT